MTEGTAAPAPPPAAPPGAAGGGALHDWAAGGAVVAGCADLLVAVLLGLAEGVADPARFSVPDLALPAAAAGIVSFGFAAAAWGAGSRGLHAAAAFHGAVAVAGWFLVPRALGGIPPAALAAMAVHAAAAALALAGAAAARGDGEGEARAKAASAARGGAENLESVLVAIVFALVIRHFAVEAYKIPTESMNPTLLGEGGPRGPGDRVLVAKWPALLGGPGRWQVWVFRPPLQRTINYVKRVAGLPGETIGIEDGDLYVDGAIARKPPRTREEMWFPVWPREDSAPLRAPGPAAPESPWSGQGFRKSGEDGFSIAGAAERRLLRYEPAVLDSGWGRTGSNPVGDVRLRFAVDGAEPGTVLVVRVTGRAGSAEVRLAADGGSVETEAGGKVERTAPPSPAAPREVEVSFADLLLEARADGRLLASRELEPLPRQGRPPFGVSFGVERGGAAFRDVRLDRDVFYTGAWTFRVPPGQYFFLGDNSEHSEDSRKWRGREVREKGEGGRVFRTKSYAGPDPRTGRVEFEDCDGVFRSLPADAVEVADVPMSFVPAADLHGRAFAIFWPPRWFTRVPGGRVRVLP